MLAVKIMLRRKRSEALVREPVYLATGTVVKVLGE